MTRALTREAFGEADIRAFRRSGSNPLSPSLMTTRERLDELCRLLALGLVRLRLRQSSEVVEPAGDSSLGFVPDRSGHATPLEERA